MATHKDKLIQMAQTAKRSGMTLDQITKGAKPWAAEILEKEFKRFKPRKKETSMKTYPITFVANDRTYCHDFIANSHEEAVQAAEQMATDLEQEALRKMIASDLNSDPVDAEAEDEDVQIEDGFVALKKLQEVNEALKKAVADLRSTEEELQDARELLEKQEAANWEARNTIRNARDEAEEKAIDSLSRYKFQMFGYWAACWVHANRQAKECGLGAEPSPFWAFVQLAQKIDAKVASGRKPAGGVS